METAIGGARSRVEDYGYGDDPAHETESRVMGMFITWLTACEEARFQAANPRASFRRDVINALPTQDDPSWGTYILPQPTSSLRQRAEALWGIRIAFTHGDGDTLLITDQVNRSFAQDAPGHIPGASLTNGRLHLTNGIFHTAIRTVVQIRDVLPSAALQSGPLSSGDEP
ncbi:MAG: hypothetical protein PHU46_15645 [Rhodocyclaceae bacterium]|nr:hypothetical protein [Rhodocyclaceae bacterium]